MQSKLTATRWHLQKLTRSIERLEKGSIVRHVPTGTGIRAFQKDAAAKWRQQERARELRSQRKLVEMGLLKILRTGKNAEARLTADGRVEALKDRIITQANTLSEGWVCVVVFDIPEDVKTLRKAFRRFLKQAGFKQLQLSVWVTPKDVVTNLSQLIEQLKIQKWVHVFLGIKR